MKQWMYVKKSGVVRKIRLPIRSLLCVLSTVPGEMTGWTTAEMNTVMNAVTYSEA
ncbi:MAG: hypothetical protein ACFB0D_09695 [Phormidesmis sp.]